MYSQGAKSCFNIYSLKTDEYVNVETFFQIL